MTIKYNIQGLLIYATMCLYILALLTILIKSKALSEKLFFTGFIIATISLIHRTINVRHIPMQNLFEVFLCLGMLIYPIYVFIKRFLKADIYIFNLLLGLIVLFPAGFVFSDTPEHLPPALQSPLFGPHVAVYMLAYIILANAGYLSARNIYFYAKMRLQLSENIETKSAHIQKTLLASNEQTIYNITKLGFPLLTIGLLLGSVWGKLAWGHYWNWDPKELWSLASWLVYVAYFHYRHIYPARQTYLMRNIFVFTGFVFIVITLIWVNLSTAFSGLHSYAF